MKYQTLRTSDTIPEPLINSTSKPGPPGISFKRLLCNTRGHTQTHTLQIDNYIHRRWYVSIHSQTAYLMSYNTVVLSRLRASLLYPWELNSAQTPESFLLLVLSNPKGGERIVLWPWVHLIRVNTAWTRVAYKDQCCCTCVRVRLEIRSRGFWRYYHWQWCQKTMSIAAEGQLPWLLVLSHGCLPGNAQVTL